MMRFTRSPRPSYLYRYKEWGRWYDDKKKKGANPRASQEEQKRAKITISIYGLNSYGRPTARIDHFKLIYNKVRKNRIKISEDIDILSYRFMFG